MLTLPIHPTLLALSASWDRLTLGGFEVHLSVLVGCVYLLAGYFFLIGPARRRFGWDVPPASRTRKVLWTSGVGLIFFSLNGPLHALADEYLFSAHMVQHMLLMLIMPPLLISGLPPWLVRKAIEGRWRRGLARALTNPVVAFACYNIVFIGWHFPDLYNAALLDHDLHIAQHLMFMSVAVMMWWPVFNPVPELERIPSGPLLMMYVFAFGIPSTAVSAFITLNDDVLYAWYGLAPRITELGPLDDQRLGGMIMWVPGMLLFWTAISFVFFRWTRDEFRGWGRESPEMARRVIDSREAGSTA